MKQIYGISSMCELVTALTAKILPKGRRFTPPLAGLVPLKAGNPTPATKAIEPKSLIYFHLPGRVFVK